MAQKLLIIPMLVLGLLLQAAATQADMPCASDPIQHHGPDATSEPTASTAHDHHTMHVSSREEGADPHAQMPCCAEGEAITCFISGCVSAAPAVPALSSAHPLLNLRVTMDANVNRLAIYASPPDGIFRPPIA
jgi:hypothetical protein